MSQTTYEFIAKRSKQISKQIDDLRKELAALRQLKLSLNAAKNKTSVSSGGAPTIESGTFQDMIVKVLNESPENGADASTIIELIKTKFGKEIQRSSISPQLSRLKGKDVLSLHDNVWTLTAKYQSTVHNGGEAEEANGSDLI